MPAPGVQGKKSTIVFVDNDRFFLTAMTDALTEKGFVVHTAQDGLEALAVIREIVPDYILLDIVIPKIDGGRVCAAVRQDDRLRRIPIIAFSGLSPQDYHLFPELKADAYVAKGPLPIAVENILKVISQFEGGGRDAAEGQVLGYENFRPRQIVNELLLERRHSAAMLHALGLGVLELNRDGRIVMANSAACAILERKEGQLVGELFSSLFALPHRQGVQELLVELVRSPSPSHFRTTLRLDSTEVPIRLAAIVEEQECTGLLVTVEAREPQPE
jgi:two-component system cell cycle response regulator DivK